MDRKPPGKQPLGKLARLPQTEANPATSSITHAGGCLSGADPLRLRPAWCPSCKCLLGLSSSPAT